jgi:hypothetical protein
VQNATFERVLAGFKKQAKYIHSQIFIFYVRLGWFNAKTQKNNYYTELAGFVKKTPKLPLKFNVIR